MTAWVDGALPAPRHSLLSQHLTQCARCAAEVEGLRTAITWQQQALRGLATLDDLDPHALTVRLQRELAAEADGQVPAWGIRHVWASMWGRLALAGAAVSLAAIVLLLAVGPGMVLMPLGLESPPPAVVQRTELFKDYPLIERLDVLEHFDTVESVPLDDESVSQHWSALMKGGTTVLTALVVAACIGASQQVGAAPLLAQNWRELSPGERYETLQNYRQHERLPEDSQRAIEKRYQRWQQMSPDERERIRQNYQRLQQLPPQERERIQRKYEKWRQESPPRQ